MKFQDISGNQKVRSLLCRAIEGGRVAHAYVFAGPPGVGKLQMARAMATALNCEDFCGDSCGRCAACLAMAEGAHLNYIEIEPEKGVLKIEKVRDVLKVVSYRVERGCRVVVVNGADKMAPGAANAFLKTLEEPPAGTIIILISSSPDSLLPTILSRCQRINFRPLAVRDVVSELGDYALEDQEKRAAAMLSGGSVERAKEALDGGVFERRRELFDRFASLGTMNGAALIDEAARLAKDEEILELLDILKGWYRDRLVAGLGCDGFVVNCDLLKGGRSGAEYGAKGFVEAFRALEEARTNITPPRYCNKALTIETLMTKLGELEASF